MSGLEQQYRSEDQSKNDAEGKQLIYWAVDALKEVPHPTLVAEGIRDFEWSPKDNMIAYWAPEKGNIPAKVKEEWCGYDGARCYSFLGGGGLVTLLITCY